MSMKKILKEWRSFTLTEGNKGLYDLIGAPEGILDVFFDHFIGSAADRRVKEWARSKLGEFDVDAAIEEARAEMPLKLKLRSVGNSTIEKSLQDGWSVWWDRILGMDPARELVEFKVGAWEADMKSEISSGNMSAVKELMFFVDYLEDFFDKHVKTMGSRGDIYFTNKESGLYGQLQDWYIGSTGGVYYDFLEAMRAAVKRLNSWRKDPEVRNSWEWLRKK